ncbi:MAG: DUF1080 domain-containing protein [Balneolaceae bacterium]
MKSLSYLFLFIFSVSCSSCSEGMEPESPSSEMGEPSHNQLTAAERNAGWTLLFDGESTDGWRNYKSDTMEGWVAEEGVLKTSGGNGDIISEGQYSEFELSVDWRIEEQGNSGIFYFVVEKEGVSRIHETGPEFQIIDENNYPVDLQPNQVTGSLSDVYPPYELLSNPPGEWNTAKVVVEGASVEHWLNGTLILAFTMDTPEWEQAVEGSKFDAIHYAVARTGHLAFQDHGNTVEYRTIKIREL